MKGVRSALYHWNVLFFVLMFKGRPCFWSTQLISLSPETTAGIWTKPYGNHRLLKCVYINFLANLSTNKAALASDCLMYFRLLLWNCCMDFTGSNYLQIYNAPKQLVFFVLVQPDNYMIALVSYWLTRFQFLRNGCSDSNRCYKMLGKVGTILN